MKKGLLVFLIAAGLVVSCVDLPVREEIDLHLLANGVVVARLRTAIAADDASNPTFTAEAREAREAAAAGRDPWALRLADLGAVADRSRYERHQGVLSEVLHEVVLDDPEQLGRLFAQTPLSLRLTLPTPDPALESSLDGEGGAGWFAAEGAAGSADSSDSPDSLDSASSAAVADAAWHEAELEILPGVPDARSRRDEERFDRGFDRFATAATAHLAALSQIYTELAHHPERQEVVVRALLRPDDDDLRAALSDEERARLDWLGTADEALVDALVVPRGEARSLDALSRRLHDPFPGPIRVFLPSRPWGELEGFRCEDADCRVVVAQGPGLWAAFASLAERWVTPDPLLTVLAAGDGGVATTDTAAGSADAVDPWVFIARERRWPERPPSRDEIATALREALAPAPVYRVRFGVSPAAEPDLAAVWGR